MVPPFLRAFILVVFLASLALADDFKTIDGKEYKNATVKRVEPDGILLETKTAMSKVYFIELPKAVQERFHYDAAQATQFTTLQQAAIAESNEAVAVQEQEEAQERQHRSGEIARQQQEFVEQQAQADANLVQQQQIRAKQRRARQPQKATARQTAERARQRQIAGAVANQRALDDQRIDRENRRNLENMQRQKDLGMQQSRVDWARQNESRESYRRELEQLNQLRDRQRWEQGNRATAY